MAARWIACARPKKLGKTARKRTFRHAMGAVSALFIAAAGNFALHHEALAEVVGEELQLMGFVPEEPALGGMDALQQAVELNEAEVRLLAATVWGEARSEGELGMRAVAHVMVNRVGERFGEDLTTVLLTPKQFSVWNRGDPNRRLVQNLVRDPARYVSDFAQWETAQRIAREVLSGQSVDPTGGALFYHTRAVRPRWSSHGVGRQVIGAHVFYADVPDSGQRRTPRVTNVAHIFGQPLPIDPPDATATAQNGPRAGRVRGVIRQAPQSMARQVLPSERSDPNAAATPTINGVPISQLR